MAIKEANRVPSSDESVNVSATHRPETIDILVGIPAYNEEIGIGSVILAAQQYADAVVVVDDGSSDNTVAIAKEAGATVIQHEQNTGKGGAIKSFFRYADSVDCRAVVLIDGDGQHVPADIPAVVDPVLNEDADLVVGSRYLEGSHEDETPLYRRLGQRTLDWLTTTSTGTRLTDSQSGFRALSPAAVEQLELTTNGIGVESEIIEVATRNQLTITERPIDVRYENIDGQTYNPLHHGLTVVTFILQLIRDKHPLLFFGVPGVVCTLAGTLYGINAILIYQNLGVFYPAKVLVAGFLAIVGILGIFCGLILNSIANSLAKAREVSA